MKLWLAPLLVTALLSATAQAASSSGAVAVMPFKNLSGGHDLDWLKVGIAETLIADLSKDGSRKVVERDQIDRALAEVTLQAAASSEDGLAARAGKLVGATTVVLGGFQQQGNELRITARFVDVESGVVEDTAKITGPLDDVFGLQDQITAKLLKKASAARPKKKAPKKKQIEAYESWALSRATSSQTERINYLREAVASDPEFDYALDDLKALEARLNRLRDTGNEVLDETMRQAVTVARDATKTTEERTQAIMKVFGALTSTFRWNAALNFANEVYRLDVPKSAYLDVHEQASFYVFLANIMLKRPDDALKAGESHLREFPGSLMSGNVDLQMRNLIDDRRRLIDANASAAKELAKIDEDQATVRGDQREVRGPMFGFQRCTAVYRGRLYDDAITRCRRWAHEHRSDDEQHLDELARYFAALSCAELGRFDEARAELVNLQREDETWARSMGIPSILSTWPRE